LSSSTIGFELQLLWDMSDERLRQQQDQGLDLYAAISREKELAEDAKRTEANTGASRFAEATGRHGGFKQV